MKIFRNFLLISILVAACLVWYAVFFESRSGISVYVFDVGQGDSIFIQAQNGNQVLIDGGPDNTVLTRLGEVMPFYDRSIDMIILTHPHADHVDGLVEVLQRYEVGRVVESGAEYPTSAYLTWHKLIEEKRIPVTIAMAGQRYALDEGLFLTLLTPLENYKNVSMEEIHDAMVVSRLDYGEASILLTGDMEADLERKLVYFGAPLDTDILKIGHHGSKTSSSEEFLKAVTPELAVASLGEKNRYGHPHEEVVARFRNLRIPFGRTDAQQTILLKSIFGLDFQAVLVF